MATRPSVAAAVRILYVDGCLDREHGDDTVREVSEPLGHALVNLSNLETLELPGWGGRWLSPIGSLLPRGSPLPSLKHYYGPAEAIDNIQSSVPATIRIASYRPRAMESSRALLAAARFSGRTLRALEFRNYHGSDDKEWIRLVLPIISLFPNIRFLGLGYWYSVNYGLIDQLAPTLVPLESLRLLFIGEPVNGGSPPDHPTSSPTTDEIWTRNDYQKYLVNPQTDGFEYRLTEYWA